MMSRRVGELFCGDEARRAQVMARVDLNGIDYVEVSAESLNEQPFLHVFFLKSPPPAGLAGHPELFRVEGGVRTRNMKVLQVTLVDEHLVVEVDRAGDFSTYRLIIKSEALDPVYAEVDFSFKAGCPSRFDCRPRSVCPPEQRFEPLIDYLAKDYASFRQALMDLIPTLVPDWQERHEADLGVALVELLSYVGDQLSYYQDAVANEAYLDTARQRISVRRHARLIDYRVHEGASARTFVHLKMSDNTSGVLLARTPIQVLTRIEGPLGSSMPPHPTVIPKDLRDRALSAADAVFETMTETDIRLHSHLNKIDIYTWGDRQCCLPRGTTTVDLARDLTGDPNTNPPTPPVLKPGDFLLFEEVKGVRTGLEVDADPTHRQVVRLTKVEKVNDPLPKKVLTRVTWNRADALTFPLCVCAKRDDAFVEPGGDPNVVGVSVARGNLVLADHGRTITSEEHGGPQPPTHPNLRRAHRFLLNEGPLSYRIPPPKENGVVTPARELLATDPRQAEPEVTRLKVASIPQDWDPPVPHLLDSNPFDRHFVVETDNGGRAQLRFGDGEYGMAPPDEEELDPDKSRIAVDYRVGVGTSGNVGAGSLRHVVEPDSPDVAQIVDKIVDVRNPLPAWGGTDAEPLERVRQLAPAAFHAEQLRAVTEADYARTAEKHPEVSRAVATFRWTGSWHTVFVTIDPEAGTDVSTELRQSVRDWVTRFTQAGYDLEISRPIFVPLEIEIEVCVSLEHFRGDVEEALLEALSDQTLPDGTRGFFHPANFTFGQPLYLSRLYAAVEAVEGVDSAVITKFQRFGKSANGELKQGFIPMDRLEIVRLDNDPSFPENGVLQLNMRGAK
jgi:hypothetical protein